MLHVFCRYCVLSTGQSIYKHWRNSTPLLWSFSPKKPSTATLFAVSNLLSRRLDNSTLFSHQTKLNSISRQNVQSEVSNSMVIQHYHYQSWQESKAPESATGVVELCEQVMKVQRHSGNKPIVIHCR